MHTNAQLRQSHDDCVYQKWHILVNNLQHGVGAVPTVDMNRRFTRTHVRRATTAYTCKLQHAHHQCSPLFRRTPGKLIRFHPAVKSGPEPLYIRLHGHRTLLAQYGKHRLQVNHASRLNIAN